MNQFTLVALLTLAASSSFCADVIAPQAAVQFKGGCQDEAKLRSGYESMGKNRLTFRIESENVRIGGANVSVSRNYLDLESGAIVCVTYRAVLDGNSIVLGAFNPGTYTYSIENGGIQLSSGTEEFSGDSKIITLVPPIAISGSVVGFPVEALEDPLIVINGCAAQVKVDNKFSLKIFTNVVNTLRVKWRTKNRYPELSDQPLLRFEVTAQTNIGELSGDYRLDLSPCFDKSTAVYSGKIALSDKLIKFGLQAVLKNTIVAMRRSVNGFNVAYKCSPDNSGKFVFGDIPAGKYSLELYHEGGMGVPLQALPQDVELSNGTVVRDAVLQVP
jgi:hypothetical protein